MYVKTFGSGDDVYVGDEGAPDNVDVVYGGAGVDQISGGLDADILHGDEGDDLLNGGVGDDILDGGEGDDTAVFSGAAGDYVWSGDRISATITGPDGTDTLVNVERLRFGATVIDLPAPNAAPGPLTDSDAAANTVAEDAANGTAVVGLALSAVDPDVGQVLTYSLLDDAGGRFAIDPATGVVTVADASKLSFETATSHQITVQVSDGTATSSANFTIEVTNAAPTTPLDADTAVNAVSEGAADGATVGVTASATDPKTGAVTYSLADDAGGRFAIDPVTGVVTVADATKLNFETAPSHQITILATDGQGAFSSQNFTIAVTNVANGAPTDGDGAANTVSEGAVNGAVVAGLAIGAADVNGGPLVYSLLDNAGGRFAIDAATGVVTVANANLLNFETATSHVIVVQASSGTESASASFTIDVTNAAPAAPSDINGAANRVSEHATNGTVVAGLTLTAPDPHGGTVTYSLTDDAGGRFAIDAATGVVTVANASLLDADTQGSHTLTVRASDGALTSSSNITVTLIDEIDSYWTGTAGADGFTVPDVQDWQLTGLDGNDTLTGGVGDDILIGGSGNNTLSGGAGNDTFLIGPSGGNDIFDGGAGTDTIKFTASNVIVTVRSIAGMEVIDSGSFTNVGFQGTDRNDVWDFSGMAGIGTMSVYAGLGNDTINGTQGNDILRGQDGNDVLYGNNGDDIFEGGVGDDALIGGNGNDLFLVGEYTGQDGYDGGAGFDEIRAYQNNATIFLSSLANVEKISSGGFAGAWIGVQYLLTVINWDFTNVQLQGIGYISGGNQGDTIIGSAGNDTIVGNGGPDTLKGGAGDDTFVYGGSDGTNYRFDTVDGGAGWDKLVANGAGATIELGAMTSVEELSTGGFANVALVMSTANDTLDLRTMTVTGKFAVFALNGGDDTFYGTAGADFVDGGAGNDFIDTGDGDDIIQLSFGAGWDDIRGGAGYDKIIAPGGGAVWVPFNFQGIEEVVGSVSGNTQIHGTSGDDMIDLRGVKLTQIQYITGELGNDTIHGTYDNDVIMGTGGLDTIYGESGDDRIYFTAYGDTDAVDGGSGYDTLAAWSQGVIIAVSSMTNIEAIDGAGNANVGVAFTDGNDNFNLTNIAVTGVAYIDLKAGDDIFVGSASADRIVGGLGSDTMTGGAGADVFDFNDATEGNWDVITDFVSGVDRIDLSTIDASPANSQGNHAFVFLGTGDFTHATGQVRYAVTSDGVVFSGDVNGDGVADFNVTMLGVSSLTAADFVL
ncbi:cadherin domain-containing protein [Caulobacter sp. 1776]|uniref:beta strand repeat-containing protein n=1 Tax=Caulobacter sp. 1776 TaxID=3156420 RepID=UPI003391203B